MAPFLISNAAPTYETAPAQAYIHILPNPPAGLRAIFPFEFQSLLERNIPRFR